MDISSLEVAVNQISENSLLPLLKSLLTLRDRLLNAPCIHFTLELSKVLNDACKKLINRELISVSGLTPVDVYLAQCCTLTIEQIWEVYHLRRNAQNDTKCLIYKSFCQSQPTTPSSVNSNEYNYNLFEPKFITSTTIAPKLPNHLSCGALFHIPDISSPFEIVLKWLQEHPSKNNISLDDKLLLCHSAGLTLTQLNNWLDSLLGSPINH